MQLTDLLLLWITIEFILLALWCAPGLIRQPLANHRGLNTMARMVLKG